MRARTRSTLAGAGLAAVAAVLLAGCGDSGSAKGSPAPAKTKEKTTETLPPANPPVKTLEPIAPPPAPEPAKPKEPDMPKDPLPPPAPPPAPVEDKTTLKPATEKALETTSYKCEACSKVATVSKTALAPTCCGTTMKPQP